MSPLLWVALLKKVESVLFVVVIAPEVTNELPPFNVIAESVEEEI
jgi:hypothetical protein